MLPIQTEYKGYRFRSRLEARWAVFLDALNAKWSYETEGYDLDGTWYLPDFWVADWKTWIEIKGKTPSAEEERKCDLLARASGMTVLLVDGEPWIERGKSKYNVTLFDRHDHELNGTPSWEFGEGRRCADEIWIVSGESGAAFTLRPVPHDGDHNFPLIGSYAKNIISALTAARGARFEHGESGQA